MCVCLDTLLLAFWEHILLEWLVVKIVMMLMLNIIVEEPTGMFTETFPLDL